MAKIYVLNPTAPEIQEVLPRVSEPTPFRESRVIVFHNGKPNAREVMERVAEQLSERYGVIHAGSVVRPESAAADLELLDYVAENCDWAMIGSCD